MPDPGRSCPLQMLVEAALEPAFARRRLRVLPQVLGSRLAAQQCTGEQGSAARLPSAAMLK